jgi:hypothetical protein
MHIMTIHGVGEHQNNYTHTNYYSYTSALCTLFVLTSIWWLIRFTVQFV